MLARAITGMLIVLMIVSVLAGCGAAPVLASSPVQYVLKTSPAAASTTTAADTAFTPSPTVDTLEPTPELTDIEEMEEELTPEPTDPPGVWVEDENYIFRGSIDEISYNLLEANVTADDESIKFAKEYNVLIGGWEYFFDTNQAVLEGADYSQAYEFMLCRKNQNGEIQNLNIYGSKIDSGRGYLFLYNNLINGPESTNWDAWMLSPEGNKMAFLGDVWDIYIPDEGEYFYFSDSELNMFRMDFSGKRLAHLSVLLPNKADISKEISIVYFSIIYFKDIKSGWMYFTADIDSFFEKRFVGNYKMSLGGGLVYKIDNGIWYDYSEDGETTE